MKEKGMTITDFLAAAVGIAHQEYPSELAERRDNIIQGLYDFVPTSCVECANTGRQPVHCTGDLVSEAAEESQNPLTDLGEGNFSDQSSEEVAKDSHEEQRSERTGIKIVIKLNKNKNKSVDATERPKSEEIKAIEAATNNNSSKTDDFQNEDISGIKFEKIAKRKVHESNELAANGEMNVDENISGIKFENDKRKLHEGYELAANTKKQRCIKTVAPHQLPTQELGNRPTQQKNQHGSSAKARIESN